MERMGEGETDMSQEGCIECEKRRQSAQSIHG